MIALDTNLLIHPVPTPVDVAIRQIGIGLESSRLLLLSDAPMQGAQLRALLEKGKVQDTMVHDTMTLSVPGMCFEVEIESAGRVRVQVESGRVRVERFEVMHGPSSVLFGQSGPGGMVNTVGKRPFGLPQHEVGPHIGNHATRQLSGDATGPLDAGDEYSVT